jgi:hypothetical protein
LIQVTRERAGLGTGIREPRAQAAGRHAST